MSKPMDKAGLLAALMRERFGDAASLAREAPGAQPDRTLIEQRQHVLRQIDKRYRDTHGIS